MDSTGDSETRLQDTSGSTGSNGQSQPVTGKSGNDDLSEIERIERDLASAESGDTGQRETERKGPGYTLPPSATVEKKRRGRKPGSTNRPSVNSGVSPTACAGLLQGISLAASWQLTGTFDLALSGGDKIGAEALNPEDEAGSLGKALADCLDTIPNSPVSKMINVTGPWMRFAGLVAAVILARFTMIMIMKNQGQSTRNSSQDITQRVEQAHKIEETASPTRYTINCGICGQGMHSQDDLQRHVMEVHRGT